MIAHGDSFFILYHGHQAFGFIRFGSSAFGSGCFDFGSDFFGFGSDFLVFGSDFLSEGLAQGRTFKLKIEFQGGGAKPLQSVFHNLIPNKTGFLKLIVEGGQ